MRDFAKAFYLSKEWRRARAYVFNRDAGLCVRCGALGEIVHHNAEIADKYQMGTTGQKAEETPKEPQEPPSGGPQDTPEPEEGQEPTEPKDGKEGA